MLPNICQSHLIPKNLAELYSCINIISRLILFLNDDPGNLFSYFTLGLSPSLAGLPISAYLRLQLHHQVQTQVFFVSI